ncbi:Acyl carrier protein phosphodiesterase [Vibrio stylophorae]|uniref:Acyl carrier protein phosphodiesterase n=2 Tax=Vibrio stylophorae TaxID=659351 RepID=A0ABN8DRQ3_9VIBR|nr:Acyl carrier protein phosphodiesterase [Vibrio stylophorae]
MNYFAHILLSPLDIDYQLGNLLADPLKARPWPQCSAAHQAGLQLHLKIDRFTDAHPCVAQSKARLGDKGRLRGVVVDIAYDYLLHQHWAQFVTLDKSQFLQQFHQQALQQVSILPDSVQIMVARLVRYQVLASYQSIQGIQTALSRLDNRLSSRVLARESASQYAQQLEDVLPEMASDFCDFFSDLIIHLQAQVDLPHLIASR